MRVEDSQVSFGGGVRFFDLSFRKESIRFIEEEKSENSFGVIPVRFEMDPISAESVEDARELLVKKILEMLTGKKIKTLSINDITRSDIEPIEEPKFGAEYRKEELSVEVSALDFYAYGFIKTKEGEVINFEVSLKLLNVEVEVSSESVRSGSLALVDPLIIDLSGSPDLLSPAKFEFDLEGDGKKENIPYLAGGKGFVFFDMNKNDVADGGEIIGVKSGDAFSELKNLDVDNNGWIDEGDGVFEDLKVWIKNIQEDRVVSLKDLGVGALYTGSLDTFFKIRDSGVIGDLGVYVTESGDAGTLAKVDFLV